MTTHGPRTTNYDSSVDNLCHTLAGAAFAEAGLKRTTRLGSATLMIASNLPDVDALVFATDLPSVAFRRGWTHGVLAQALLPLALASVMFSIGRHRGARFAPLLLLAYVGVVTHVALDLLNNYGVRLLMPFSGRWFYGDSVFIIDVWLWLTLGAGVWLAWSRARPSAARIALLAAAVYIGGLVMSARAAREFVEDHWRLEHRTPPRALMVGPMPVTPFRRAVIVDAGDAYATGTFRWMPRQITFARRVVKNDSHQSVRAAIAGDARFPAVLTWARFPYYEVEATPRGDLVTLRDLRFGDRVGVVSTIVPRGAAATFGGSSYRADPSRSCRPSRIPSLSPSRSSSEAPQSARR
jgi:inner membrane protein